jgi:hypothetical protein
MPIGSEHWVGANMVSDLHEIEGPDRRVAGVGFTVTNRFFHAGRPLGWFRGFAVEVDSRAISPDAVTLILRGQRFPVRQLPTLVDVWWQPLEKAQVEVLDQAITHADHHQIALVLELPLVTFTPVVDVNEIYPINPARLEAVLPTTTAAEAH